MAAFVSTCYGASTNVTDVNVDMQQPQSAWETEMIIEEMKSERCISSGDCQL